jgi:putative copper resistance protein D
MALDLPLAQHVATVTLNLALAIAVGAGLSRLSLADSGSPWARLQASRLSRASLTALTTATLASICVLWLEAAAMAEVPVSQAGDATWSMLTATHLGIAWTIGIGALIFSAGAVAPGTHGRRPRRLIALNLLGLVVFLFTRSMVSHASANGDFSVLMIADWIHLVLICVWTGEIFVSGFLILASHPGGRTDDRDDCARYIESLSTSATLALAGILATGLYGAWHNVGTPSALIGNAYGTTLLLKLALVALAVMLGGINRFFVMPSLIAALHEKDSASTSAALQRFTLILRVEAGVLLGALILAAILSSTSPPTAG